MWQHALPPRGYIVSYYVGVLIGTPALGPFGGPCLCCIVMATVVIDKVNPVAGREERLRRYYLFLCFLYLGLAIECCSTLIPRWGDDIVTVFSYTMLGALIGPPVFRPGASWRFLPLLQGKGHSVDGQGNHCGGENPEGRKNSYFQKVKLVHS